MENNYNNYGELETFVDLTTETSSTLVFHNYGETLIISCDTDSLVLGESVDVFDDRYRQH